MVTIKLNNSVLLIRKKHLAISTWLYKAYNSFITSTWSTELCLHGCTNQLYFNRIIFMSIKIMFRAGVNTHLHDIKLASVVYRTVCDIIFSLATDKGFKYSKILLGVYMLTEISIIMNHNAPTLLSTNNNNFPQQQ